MALVPLECWGYSSPERLARGSTVDIGLLCESLIYYDQILINLSNEPQFAEFVGWFRERGKLEELLAMLKDQTLTFYHYAFVSAPARMPDGTYRFFHLQDEQQAQQPTFRRVVKHESFLRAVPDRAQRDRIEQALDGRVIEAKASEFGDVTSEARHDFVTKARNEIATQLLLDSVLPFSTKPHQSLVVDVKIVDEGNGKIRANYNVDFDQVGKFIPARLGFQSAAVMSGLLVSNKHIASAAHLECDLYCGSPMSQLVGDKLADVERTADQRTSHIIGSLVAQVDFPDVRWLINGGKIPFSDVLELRKRGTRFREWLRDEAGRDRDAIIAYHNEVAKESQFRKGARKLLAMFGVGLGVAAPVISPEPVSQALVGGAGALTGVIASKLGRQWKPVAFGQWASDYIEKQMRARR